jgi:hypothetical protein
VYEITGRVGIDGVWGFGVRICMKQRTCVLDESCSSGVLVRVLAASWVGVCDCRFVLNEDALSAHCAFGVGVFGEGDEV